MDISKWSLSEVMQLPDHAFGERYWVGEYMGGTGGVVERKIGADVLPKKFVVWGVLTSCNSPSCIQAMRVTIRLCDALDALTVDCSPFERLLKNISTRDIVYELYVNANGVDWIPIDRQLVLPSFRRLGFITNGDQSNTYEMTVGVLISDVPREVPDWLIGR